MSEEPPSPPPTGSGAVLWLLTVVFLAGGCTLVVELAAVRLLAPWFGASAGVWTNVIGVILLALALGYLVGARLAARPGAAGRLALVLLLAGLFAAWLPALAAPVCGLFLPEGLSLQQAAGLWLWGSLASSLLLFLPPAALLGCVGPLAVEVLQVRRGIHAGTAGGIVLCASTLGSLVGTFATTHLLIPHAGLSKSFAGAGAALVACGAVAWIAARRDSGPLGPQARARGLGSALLLGTMLATLGALPGAGSRFDPPALRAGMTLLETAESPYQSLRVVEDTTLGQPLRLLQVNEGLDSFQSVWSPRSGLLGAGFYYDYFALPAWLSPPRRTWKVLVLGLGAGTTFRVLEGALPEGVELEAWGVELDARILDLARRWFDLPVGRADRVVLAGEDARSALRRLPRDFDLIVLDAYSNQVEIPAHLSTVEFFGEARGHLVEGGWLAVNAGGFGADDPVVGALGRTLAEAFPVERESLAVRVPFARNWVLFARRQAALPRPDAAGAARGPEWTAEVDSPGARLIAPLTLPGSVARFSHAPDERDAVLRDDRNPMEVLQRRSLEQGRRRLRGAL